jgi:hypothetical protein
MVAVASACSYLLPPSCSLSAMFILYWKHSGMGTGNQDEEGIRVLNWF